MPAGPRDPELHRRGEQAHAVIGEQALQEREMSGALRVGPRPSIVEQEIREDADGDPAYVSRLEANRLVDDQAGRQEFHEAENAQVDDDSRYPHGLVEEFGLVKGVLSGRGVNNEEVFMRGRGRLS